MRLALVVVARNSNVVVVNKNDYNFKKNPPGYQKV